MNDETPTHGAEPFERMATAFQEFANTLVRALGPRAPRRKRPARVAKKLAARGGYAKPGSLGALLHEEDVQS